MTDIIRCVVCDKVCDETGLCDDHKYKEQAVCTKSINLTDHTIVNLVTPRRYIVWNYVTQEAKLVISLRICSECGIEIIDE